MKAQANLVFWNLVSHSYDDDWNFNDDAADEYDDDADAAVNDIDDDKIFCKFTI